MSRDDLIETTIWIAIYLVIHGLLTFFLSGAALWGAWAVGCVLVTAVDFLLRWLFLGVNSDEDRNRK